MQNEQTCGRTKIFISKATPGDNAFALWLAARLEAEGYEVFADILNLLPADRWRMKITRTLQNKTVKMLLCCSDETLQSNGVLEEISIAEDLRRLLGDERFIVPLKMKRFKPVFGISSLQWIDFEGSWTKGFTKLLEFFANENVPKSRIPKIQPVWADYVRRQSVIVSNEPEVLTSNWLRVLSVPECINFIKPVGVIGKKRRESIPNDLPYPVVIHGDGYLTFSDSKDFMENLPDVSGFKIEASIPFEEYETEGSSDLCIKSFVAKRTLVNLFRQAWENHCQKQGFLLYTFGNVSASIASEGLVGISQHVSWGRRGQQRRSMLRNIAKGKVWEYGVSAQPSLFPFPHFRLKARVLFSNADRQKKGSVIDDYRAQHRLRRSVCSGWRNPAWHGRLMAYLELLAGDSPYIALPVGCGQHITLDGMPIQVTAPISASQRYNLDENAEEQDSSTLGGYFSEDEA